MKKNKSFLDARSLSILILQQSFNSVPLQQALDSGLISHKLTPQDSALCTELVYGYSRYALRINSVLDTLLRNRAGLPKVLQLTLGVSAYSLLFLTKVPHYATVDWAVSFTKQKLGLKLSKLCNAVLRSLLRLEQSPHEFSFFSNAYDFYSKPKWMYDLFLDAYGIDNSHSLLMRSLQRPKVCIRLNPYHELFDDLKSFFTSLDNFSCVGFSGFVCLDGKIPSHCLTHSLSFLHEDGAFSWQSAGSQEAMFNCFQSVPQLKEFSFWDACAGQGGKSLILIEQGVNIILASDTSWQRLMQFELTLNRLNFAKPFLLQMSATNSSLKNFNGNILLDVPCSGLGTLSRRPDISFHRTVKDLKKLVSLQKNILQNSFNILSSDRYIIYLTCTLNPSENDLLIDDFVLKNPKSEVVFSWQTPHEHPWLDGMYACVIKKNA